MRHCQGYGLRSVLFRGLKTLAFYVIRPTPAMREHFLAALNLAGFLTGTFLQQSPPSKEIAFVNVGLTYRF